MKFFLGACVLFAMMFAACNKEDNDVKSVVTADDNFELWLEQQVANTDKELTVEHATLEEINEEMVANGLEPFDQADVERAVQARSTWDCGSWIFLGDWNDDGNLSTLDLIKAQQYLCSSSAGCAGSVDTSTFPFNNERFFGYLTFLEDGTDILLLNRDDIDAGRDFILGLIVCF
ncbi:MAG: hypothetical protein AAGG75_04850 [Bacteroidota bacterium]